MSNRSKEQIIVKQGDQLLDLSMMEKIMGFARLRKDIIESVLVCPSMELFYSLAWWM